MGKRRFGLQSLSDLLVDQDMYGHPIGVNYKGADTFKTRLGAVCSLATYVLIIVNSVTLLIAFSDGSRQDEKVQFTNVDRFLGDAYALEDHDFGFGVINFAQIPPEYGQLRAFQVVECALNDNPLCEGAGEKFFQELPIEECSEEKWASIVDFWRPRLTADFFNLIISAYKCLDASDAFLQGDQNSSQSSYVKFEFVHCDPNESELQCVPLEDQAALLPNIGQAYLIDLIYKQVDMSIIEQPYQDFHQTQQLFFNLETTAKLNLAQFDDYNKAVGFLDQEPETQTFFFPDEIVGQQVAADVQTAPVLTFSVRLSSEEVVYERQVYTFFTLIGDVGGFNGAIIILPSYLISFYNARMYKLSVSKKLSYRKSGKKKPQGLPDQREALESGVQVSQEHAQALMEQAQMTRRFDARFFRSLLCKRYDKERKLREKAFKRFDKSLDIQSFFAVNMNLALLLRLFLTKEQALLFQSQAARSVIEKSAEDKKVKKSKMEVQDMITKVTKRDNLNVVKMPKASTSGDSAKMKEAIAQLLGYQVKSQLDVKLILGVYGHDPIDEQTQERAGNEAPAQEASQSSLVNLNDLDRTVDSHQRPNRLRRVIDSSLR